MVSPADFAALLEHCTFATACVRSEDPDLQAMWEAGSEEIAYEDFRAAVGEEAARSIERHHGVSASRDPYVSFHRGQFRGHPCAVMSHDSVNHIFRLD